MNRRLAFPLLMLYLLSMWRLWGPILHYQLYREEYLAACENRLRPALHCDGKCVLAKKLKAAEAFAQKASQPPAYKFKYQDVPPHTELEGLHTDSPQHPAPVQTAIPHTRLHWLAPVLVIPTPPPRLVG